MQDIEAKYIIIETSTDKIIYRLIQHSTGKMRDVDGIAVKNNNINTQNAKIITIKNLKTYTGKLTKGINDFETYCRLNDLQYLIKQYDTTKNDKQIDEISKACIDKVWWKCNKCGHEWKAYIKARTSTKSGCPMCKFNEGTYHTFVEGKNDLETWCKENRMEQLLKEYAPDNELKPSKIAAKSHKKVKWTCSTCGNTYYQMLGNRTDKNQGCPRCACSGTSFPELFIYELLQEVGINTLYRYKIQNLEADIYIPKYKMVVDYRGMYWHSGREDIDNKKYSVFEKLGLNILVIDGYSNLNNEVNENHINFNEKDYIWLAQQVFKYLNIQNIEKYNTEFINSIVKTVNNKRNSKTVLNNLVETHPEVARHWDYERNGDFKPTSITYGTKYKAWFKCDVCGRSYYSMIRKQASGQGCPLCYREGKR